MSGPLVTAAAEWYKSSDVPLIRPSIHTMPASENSTQRTQALALLKRRGMTRLAEFSEAGITATTVGRMERAGEVVRLARGLYQLPDAALDAHRARLQCSDPLQLLDAVGEQTAVGGCRGTMLGQHLLGYALVHPARRGQAQRFDQFGDTQHGQPPTRARARCSTRALRRAWTWAYRRDWTLARSAMLTQRA